MNGYKVGPVHAFRWSVSFETASIESGSAPTLEQAEAAAVLAHDMLVCQGLNPEALAYHVSEDR